ncbi:type III-A CRISPR-associated RAMP protein Csm4 [Bacteroides sp. AN502(2024)]|uniref:type III-A CRISPR-associated RAMP protein Csm4 n=1 Tax=Bacteroides sp. AN502(2024) TaxID=3160599 RepID=UPI003512B7CF
MATYNIIKIKFLTPLHLGVGKEFFDFSSSNLHSDTLTSALAAIRVQRGHSEGVLEFLSSFSLSSAFPYVGEIFYLPKAIGNLKIKVRGKAEYEYRKNLKRIKYLEYPLWASLAEGKEVEVDSEQIHHSFLSCSKDFKLPYANHVVQRVQVPRGDDMEAEPFFFDWRFFNSESGLYCLTDTVGELFSELRSLFESLGEVGIGTDKNIGGGKFVVETGCLRFPDVADARSLQLLSLYLPTKEELDGLALATSRYNLLLRGGYMAGSGHESFRHLWKKSVYMFDVGSVFPASQNLCGKVVNLQPEWNDEKMHPVYRSGRPFCIPVNL